MEKMKRLSTDGLAQISYSSQISAVQFLLSSCINLNSLLQPPATDSLLHKILDLHSPLLNSGDYSALPDLLPQNLRSLEVKPQDIIRKIVSQGLSSFNPTAISASLNNFYISNASQILRSGLSELRLQEAQKSESYIEINWDTLPSGCKTLGLMEEIKKMRGFEVCSLIVAHGYYYRTYVKENYEWRSLNDNNTLSWIGLVCKIIEESSYPVQLMVRKGLNSDKEMDKADLERIQEFTKFQDKRVSINYIERSENVSGSMKKHKSHPKSVQFHSSVDDLLKDKSIIIANSKFGLGKADSDFSGQHNDPIKLLTDESLIYQKQDLIKHTNSSLRNKKNASSAGLQSTVYKLNSGQKLAFHTSPSKKFINKKPSTELTQSSKKIPSFTGADSIQKIPKDFSPTGRSQKSQPALKSYTSISDQMPEINFSSAKTRINAKVPSYDSAIQSLNHSRVQSMDFYGGNELNQLPVVENHFWKCDKCYNYIDNIQYDCEYCGRINWEQFYLVKSKMLGQEGSSSSKNIRNEWARRGYKSQTYVPEMFSEKKEKKKTVAFRKYSRIDSIH